MLEEVKTTEMGDTETAVAEELERGRRLDRYVRRLELRISELERISDRFFRFRLGFFLAGSATVATAFLAARATWGWLLLVLLVLFLTVVAFFHGRVKKALRRHHLWASIKRSHKARTELDWTGIPHSWATSDDSTHPFDKDVDITGPQSLQQLLDCSLSEGGSELLGRWLLRKRPDLQWTLARQALVRELAPLSLFRDKLALGGALSSDPSDQGRLASRILFEWLGDSSESRVLRRALTIHSLLTATTLVLLGLHLTGVLPSLWLFSCLAGLTFFFSRQKLVESLFGEGLRLERTIRRYRQVFRHLEGFRCQNQPHLARLCQPFFDSATRPSARLGAVARLVGTLSVRAYFPVWLVVNLLLPWDFFFSWRLHKQKEDLARLLPTWLEVWFELEASNSLACFAWLHPHYAMPEFGGSDGFEAERLGHPLIPAGQRVANDFSLQGLGRVVIVTGSNMAGKSTFLRTVGVNLCLAQAGAPVCARRLRCSPFRLHACIRVSDSLVDGFSYFYAEVRRLRGMLDELALQDEIPLLFLIDEIFKGTNNRERLIGSRSFIRALVNRNGLGLISTHDLDLVRLSDELETVANLHFREDVVDGRMRFDYRLRQGPCPTTNALKIMRLEGLPVEEPE